MLIHKIKFLGTKPLHSPSVNLTFIEDISFAGSTWRVVVENDFPPPHQGRVMYDGECDMESELIFLAGFLHYFSDGYAIDGADEETQKHIFTVFNRCIEHMYMMILDGLGFAVDGRYELSSFFKTNDKKMIDELIFRLKRKINEGSKR